MHRDGENKTHIRVAWLTKDVAARFDERPEVDLRKLDKARQIWEKPIEKQSNPVENTYTGGVNNSNIEDDEFAPEVSSTPVKAGRSNHLESLGIAKPSLSWDSIILAFVKGFFKDILSFF